MSEHQNYVCCTKANGIVSNHICQLTHPFTKIDTSVDIGCKPIHHSCVFPFWPKHLGNFGRFFF